VTAAAAPPRDEAQLRARAEALAGRTLEQVAAALSRSVPAHPRHAKGWMGQLLEAQLGATAGSLPEPDFQQIGVELKTLPVSPAGKSLESTYVCTVPLEQVEEPLWERSNVRRKLARVLWFPVLTERGQPIGDRRLGWPLLWSPSAEEEAGLRADWEELMDLVCLGRVEEITAHHGTWLQMRPKAADSRARRWGTGSDGARVRTAPRGFYLRAGFTARLLARHYVLGT
jgi:DNA mismatch repair protein MutH